jgi:hypothetical protein
MKKNITVALLCLLSSLHLCAQTPVSARKLYTVNYKEPQNRGFQYEDVVSLGDHIVMLGADQKLLASSPLRLSAVTLKRFIDHGSLSTKRNKQIIFPKEFVGVDMPYLGTIVNEKAEAIKYFFTTDNPKRKTTTVIACNLDLKTDKLTFTKIFESASGKRDGSLARFRTVINQETQEFAVVEIFAKREDVTFNYVVKDFDLNTLATKQNIKTTGIDAKEINNMTLTRKYDIVFDATEVVRKAGLFRKAQVSKDIYITKEEGMQKLNFNEGNYESEVKLFSRPNGEVSAVALYGVNKTEFDGILLASVDDETRSFATTNKLRFNKLEFDNVDANTTAGKNRLEKRDARQAASISNRINKVLFSPNGDMYLQLEQFRIVTTTTTTSVRGGGVTSSTSTTYHYGPSVIYQIDAKTNEMKNFIKLNYETVSRMPINSALNFVPGNNGKIWVAVAGEFYKFDVDGRSMRVKSFKDQLAETKRMWTAVFSSGRNVYDNKIFLNPNSALKVSTSTARCIVSELPLD